MSETLTDFRSQLDNVVAEASMKGGVGKSSTTANLAGIIAASGQRVLVVDLDPQGNLGEDLGYRGTELDDEGRQLFNAVAMGEKLTPIAGVRPNLDVIPGGRMTGKLTTQLAGDGMSGMDVTEALARALAPLAPQYSLVLLDCPPGEGIMQTQALVAARWLIIPTLPDDASKSGIFQIARRVEELRRYNPTLGILGVLLWGIGSTSTRVQANARAELREMLGEDVPVFESYIRHAQASAVAARNSGQLAHELAKEAQDQDPFAWRKQLLDGEPATRRIGSSAGHLAADYIAVTREVLQTINTHTAQTNQEPENEGASA